MSKIDKIINWFEERKGKVRYSMNNRTGKGSYDCSSSVYYAVTEALDLPISYPCNTANLGKYLLENGFELICSNGEWEAKRGDIIIWARQVGVPGAYAHTAVFIDNQNLIHCNYNANGISVDSENSLIKNGLYNWHYSVYRLKNDNDDYEVNTYTETKCSKRFMICDNYSIDSLPWYEPDHKTLGSTKDYLGYVVTITRMRYDYYYSEYLGGWVDNRAFKEIKEEDKKLTIKNSGYSVDTMPWGTEGYETIAYTGDMIGNEFHITARINDYFYAHEIAKWIDKKAFDE